MSYKRNFILAALTFTALSVAPSAFADDVEFRYSKSELTTTAGAEQLYLRIHDAAEDMCEDQFAAPYAVKGKLRMDRCIRRTVKEIVGKVGHPNLNHIYAAMPKIGAEDRKSYQSAKLSK